MAGEPAVERAGRGYDAGTYLNSAPSLIPSPFLIPTSIAYAASRALLDAREKHPDLLERVSFSELLRFGVAGLAIDSTTETGGQSPPLRFALVINDQRKQGSPGYWHLELQQFTGSDYTPLSNVAPQSIYERDGVPASIDGNFLLGVGELERLLSLD